MLYNYNENKEFKLTPSKGGVAILLALLFSNILVLIVALVASLIMRVDFATFSTSDFGQLLSSAVGQISFFLSSFIVLKGMKNLVKECGLNKKIEKKDMLMTILLFFGAFFGLTVLSSLFMEFLALFGYAPTDVPLPDFTSTSNFLVGIVVIAIMPAIAEEILFRGVILRSMKRYGKWVAILFSATVFMLLHASPMQTLYQFALGVIYAIIVWKTGNLIYTIILHFLNNFLALAFEFFQISFEIEYYIIAIALVVLVFALTYFLKKKDQTQREVVSFDDLILSDDEMANKRLVMEERLKDRSDKIQTVIYYSVAFLICIATWIGLFVQGLM